MFSCPDLNLIFVWASNKSFGCERTEVWNLFLQLSQVVLLWIAETRINLSPGSVNISIGNSMVSRGIWHKYHEWYFKIVCIWIKSGIYAKYPKETILLFGSWYKAKKLFFHKMRWEQGELLLHLVTSHSLAHIECAFFVCVFVFSISFKFLNSFTLDFWQTLCQLVWKSKHNWIVAMEMKYPPEGISN